MIKLKRENLKKFFDNVSEKYPLFLPLKNGANTDYGCYDGVKEFDLDTLKTSKSPKDVFFPQSENMMKFRTEGKNIEIVDVREEKQSFVVFGVRACDFKAFSVLDNVFLSDPVDTYYKARRDAGIIFTLACGKPEQSCFCKVFGIDAAERRCDVLARRRISVYTRRQRKGRRSACACRRFSRKCRRNRGRRDKKTVRRNHRKTSVRKPRRIAFQTRKSERTVQSSRMERTLPCMGRTV